MKNLLFFMMLLLIALVVYFNWDSTKELITDIKQKFNKEEIKCELDTHYQSGKCWVKKKL